MLLIVDMTAKDNASTEKLAGVVVRFLAAQHAAGLLAYRIGRHEEHKTRLTIVEEWTGAAAHADASAGETFAAMRAQMAPLLAAPPTANVYDIVAGGPQA